MDRNRKLLKVGITIGDFNGIGPELIMRALSHQYLRKICTPIVYGAPRVINVYRKLLDLERFSYNMIQTPDQAQPRKVSVIDCIRVEGRVEPGRPNQDSGLAAFQALTRATKDLKDGLIDTLVTMPIDKHFIQNEDFKFPGHTEFLTEAFEARDSLLFMVHERLKVGLVTGHVPLNKVSENIGVDKIVLKIKIMDHSLRMDFNFERPKIAVLGLNPHAGDNGFLGEEEQEIIQKAVKKCSNEKMLVLGPYSADGFFASGMYRKFDGILAMYHDQGLIPFKLIAGFEGVNFTAGLPLIRTSPDHGPAFDLVGKEEASPDSFIHALYTAIDIYHRREENYELHSNSIWNSVSKMYSKEIPDSVEE